MTFPPAARVAESDAQGQEGGRAHPGGAAGRTAVAATVSRTRGGLVVVATCLLGLAWAVAATRALTSSGTPVDDLARYALYWGLCVVVPGTVVAKAIRGTTGSWLADLALGATTGLAAELAAWAVAGVLDQRVVLRLWPLLTLVLLVGRRTRDRILSRPDRPWSLPALTVITASCLQVVWLVNRSFLQAVPLPPSGRSYYPDLLWHLGLVNEATRTFPLGTPQAVDDGLLVYHWFSDAHIAAASLASGVDTTLVLLRLWILPIGALTVVLTAVLTRRVSGSQWAGAGAAALVSTTVTVPFWPSIWTSNNQFSPLSPSQQYSMPLTLFLVHSIVELLRARPGARRGPVLLVAIAGVVTSGSKSSALPIVLGGIALATVAALALRRDRRVMLSLLGSFVVATVLAQRYVAGGSFGAGVQLFSALSLTRPYRLLHGQAIDFHTPVLAGLVDTPGVGPLLLVALLAVAALIVLRLLPAFLPLVQRSLRRDLAAWLLSGACLFALGPFVALGHVGYSEYYFVFGAIPFGCVLAMWSLSALVRANRGSARITLVVAAGSALLTLAVGWYRLQLTPDTTRVALVDDLTWFVVTLAAACLVLLAALGVALLRRRRGDPRWVAGPLAALVAMCVASGPLDIAVTAARDAPPPRHAESAMALDESTAALWIKNHVPLDAVMATNAHCTGGQTDPCDSRIWWISGLGGRRVLIEAWGYLPNGLDGYPDRRLLALNQLAFEQPSASAVLALKSRGVTWLVAQTVPGSRPSDRLGEYARERYRLGPIVIYQLAGHPTAAP